MSFFYIPRTPMMTPFMYKITAKKEDDRLDLSHLLHLYELPFLVLIPSVFWSYIQSKLGPIQYLMVRPLPPLSLGDDAIYEQPLKARYLIGGLKCRFEKFESIEKWYKQEALWQSNH